MTAATGKSAVMDIHHWWRFRDGKICPRTPALTADVLSAG